jgi:MoaA/NifB/PqqE/SkfB family radical SAM enzyme
LEKQGVDAVRYSPKMKEIPMERFESVKRFLVKEAALTGIKAMSFIGEDRIYRLMDTKLESLGNPEARKFVEHALTVSKKILNGASAKCREKALINFLLNTELFGTPKRINFEKQYGFPPPYTILFSPTMRCNLHCTGCYASEYSQKDDLDLNVINRVIDEAKSMGSYLITLLGGEPLTRKDIFELIERQKDAYFQIFTNATLIDEKIADKIADLGNIYISVSLDGLEEFSDGRRGKGTFQKTMHAIDLLSERGVMKGFSAMVTRENHDEMISDEFIDLMVEKNCFLGWYFAYMPVGRNPDLDLMPTPEQRLYRLERMNYLRDTKNIVLADFWNDAPLVEGCIAGGRYYIHINNNGDVEPCIFLHFSEDNIKDKSLIEALNSPFFQSIRRRQPYNDNLLMPCMIIDNPQVLRDIIAETDAKPTHPEAEDILTGEMASRLDEYSKNFSSLCNPVWKEYSSTMKPRNRHVYDQIENIS